MDAFQELARRNANLSPHELQLTELEKASQENQAKITKLAQQQLEYQETLVHFVAQESRFADLVSRLASQAPDPQNFDQAVQVLTKVVEVVTVACQKNALVNALQELQKQAQKTAELRRRVAVAREALAKTKAAAQQLQAVTAHAAQVDQALLDAGLRRLQNK